MVNHIIENKDLILEVKEKLEELLENAPGEEDLGDEYATINFYAEVQNLVESIEVLYLKDTRKRLKCYRCKFTLTTEKGDSLKNFIVFSENISEAITMINKAFITKPTNSINYKLAHFKQINPKEIGLKYPNEPQFVFAV